MKSRQRQILPPGTKIQGHNLTFDTGKLRNIGGYLKLKQSNRVIFSEGITSQAIGTSAFTPGGVYYFEVQLNKNPQSFLIGITASDFDYESQ